MNPHTYVPTHVVFPPFAGKVEGRELTAGLVTIEQQGEYYSFDAKERDVEAILIEDASIPGNATVVSKYDAFRYATAFPESLLSFEDLATKGIIAPSIPVRERKYPYYREVLDALQRSPEAQTDPELRVMTEETLMKLPLTPERLIAMTRFGIPVPYSAVVIRPWMTTQVIIDGDSNEIIKVTPTGGTGTAWFTSTWLAEHNHHVDLADVRRPSLLSFVVKRPIRYAVADWSHIASNVDEPSCVRIWNSLRGKALEFDVALNSATRLKTTTLVMREMPSTPPKATGSSSSSSSASADAYHTPDALTTVPSVRGSTKKKQRLGRRGASPVSPVSSSSSSAGMDVVAVTASAGRVRRVTRSSANATQLQAMMQEETLKERVAAASTTTAAESPPQRVTRVTSVRYHNTRSGNP